MTTTSFACTRYQVVPRIFAMIFGEFILAYHGIAKVEQLLIVSLYIETPHPTNYLVSLILSFFESSTYVQCS
jgi:hypothetical protein